jgi:hypothetical protein
MRHFTILMFILFSRSLSAQAYQPFVQDNHRWMVSWDIDNTLWDFDDFYENVFGADTLINDTSYTMVWRNYYARTGEPGGFETIIQPFEPGFQDELIGFVREDTTLQRVYYRSEDAWISDQEFLLYDFNLEVGDMIIDSLVGAGPYQVVQLDTIFSHDALRRVWSLDDGQTITEGIGSNFGPFEGITNLISGGYVELYQFCNGPAMDCHVAIDGMVNNRRLFNIRIYSYGISTPNSSIRTYEHRFIDTIHVNNHVYFRPYSRQLQYSPTFQTYSYDAFRQDEQKVYYLDLFTEQEFLAYDFSLEVGDTISYPVRWQPADQRFLLTVTEVDSLLLLNGEKRKSIHLSVEEDVGWGYSDVTWVEDIGEFQYPFDPYYRIFPPTDGPDLDLQCFYLNDGLSAEPDYINPFFGNCYIYVVTNEDLPSEKPVVITPNPTFGILRWSGSFPEHRILLYNNLGQPCGTFFMKHGEVDISALPNGSYFYQVIDDQELINATGKLIKQ